MVNNHGDRFRPLRIGLWDPLQMAFLWHINGANPNHVSKSWDPILHVFPLSPAAAPEVEDHDTKQPSHANGYWDQPMYLSGRCATKNNTDSKEGDMTFVQPYDVFFFNRLTISHSEFLISLRNIYIGACPRPVTVQFFFVSVSVSGHFFLK